MINNIENKFVIMAKVSFHVNLIFKIMISILVQCYYSLNYVKLQKQQNKKI